MTKIETESIAQLVGLVKDHVRHHLRALPPQEVVAVDRVEAFARELAHRMSEGVFEAWTSVLEELAIAIAGAMSFFRLGQREDPDFTFRAMVVRTLWSGATA